MNPRAVGVAVTVLGAVMFCSGCNPRGGDGVAVVVSEEKAEAEVATLPDAVVATVARLEEIAATGSHRDMARLAREVPDFRSNDGGMSHQEYWYLKLRTGDWPMEHVRRVLAYDYAIAETPEGRVYVWPYMALAKSNALSAKTARDIEELLGPTELAEFRAGASWPGYRLGIREDGAWIYFYPGLG